MSEVVKLTIVSENGENPAPNQGAVPQNPTVGERLASARMQQDLTVEQVAGQLKWSARQIAEIEAGHYSVFPDMLTVRGFVRTYAKILKIDPTLLVQDLATEYEKLPARPLDRPKLDMPFPSGRVPLLGRHHNSSQKILGATILGVLIVLAIFVWREELLHSARTIYPADQADAAKPETVAVHPDTATAQPERNEVGQDTKTESIPLPPAAVVAGEKVNQAVADHEVVNQQNVPSSVKETHRDTAEPASSGLNSPADQNKPAVAQAAQAKVQAAPVPAANALVLKFKQDSWLQVKRLNGSVVISHLYQAGSEEAVDVSEPLSIIIGNAPGVAATLRGQNLALPLQAGSNVVNVNIK